MKTVHYSEPAEFVWDKGNKRKNLKKHNVTKKECEGVFFDDKKLYYPDPKQSTQEQRHIIVGKTEKGRLLLIVYTVRKGLVRIISARDINRKRESHLYL